MELAELATYAKEKYQIAEQHKWPDFPGCSVLCHPGTGKWVALLMRQWDTETGEMMERCDLKCGVSILYQISRTYLSAPLRMRGQAWVGIAFGPQTEPEVVFRLFDEAVSPGGQAGCTIVLEDAAAGGRQPYTDTLLPFASGLKREFPNRDAARPGGAPAWDIPKKIWEMMRLYKYGGDSLIHKAENFYRQGKWMEDYQDDAPWEGEYQRYFTTYHDLNVPQLRGYFAWRTRVRQGDYPPIAPSLAYIYLYELLNGIGTDSPEDALEKMRAFEKGYLEPGAGNPGMGKNLRKWMLEYAVIHSLPRETAARYADPAMLERDGALGVLNTPALHTEEEIVFALCSLAGKTLRQSPVWEKGGPRAKHLLARIWIHLTQCCHEKGKDFFAACFGERKAYGWHPLSNAVYYERQVRPDTDFILNESRSYHCREGVWQEVRYESLYFNKALFQGAIHEADRMLRRYFQTGRYLREKPEEAWLTPYVAAVLEEERLAELEASRPAVTIDFSALTHIRREALATRDSLLTEEETGETEQAAPEEPEEPQERALGSLDALHTQVLRALLRGQPAEDLIKGRRLMPSIVADTINEALADEVGDNILECDGSRITFVEDYREDVLKILDGSTGGGSTNG